MRRRSVSSSSKAASDLARLRAQAARAETFKLSKDPYVVDKVIDVVGLYRDPPANTVVFCVDE